MIFQTFARLSILLGLATTLLAAPSKRSIPLTEQFTSDDFQYYGVALGSWLVIEPFINPSLFLTFNETSGNASDIPVDEYHYTKQLGKAEAYNRLSKHWDTWINETDFQEMKDYGINMVRIPVGYWAFDLLEDDPYVQGQEEYLDKAIEWAHKYDIKVWVDLHGVPGSQNGFDNSGLRLDVPSWFNKTENIDLTQSVLHYLFEKYGGAEMNEKYNNTILGVEVVNEPFATGGLPISNLTDYYDFAYEDGRKTQQVNNTIIYHDAFENIGYWDYYRNSTGDASDPKLQNYNILIDHHHYEIFDISQSNVTIADHIESVVNYADAIANESHPAVVGEWTAALTDCSPWLNGVGKGARWDGDKAFGNDPVGDCSNINNWAAWTDQEKKDIRKFIEIQLDQYTNKMKGFVFWTWKTETALEWSLKTLVELDIFPQPFNNLTYITNGTDTDSSNDGHRFGTQV